MTVATTEIPGPPFKCPECPKSFNHRTTLGKHRSDVHNVKGTTHVSKKAAAASGRPSAKAARSMVVIGRPKSAAVDPFWEMIANPGAIVTRIDSVILEAQSDINELNGLIKAHQVRIDGLQKVRLAFAAFTPAIKPNGADFTEPAGPVDLDVQHVGYQG